MKETTLTNKEKYYYSMLTDFYAKCNSDEIKQMLDIIEGNSTLSLRIIDWFVTRCSYKYKLCIENNNELFNIYVSYKAQLKTYKKKYFDPFRRNSKFCFHYDIFNEKTYICTTFGQLNFFKWAISNNVLKFMQDNMNFILTTMSISRKRNKNNTNANLCEKKHNGVEFLNKDVYHSNYIYQKDLKQKSKLLNNPIVVYFD